MQFGAYTTVHARCDFFLLLFQDTLACATSNVCVSVYGQVLGLARLLYAAIECESRECLWWGIRARVSEEDVLAEIRRSAGLGQLPPRLRCVWVCVWLSVCLYIYT